jgi:DNA-binding transcriptional LysR family regulator
MSGGLVVTAPVAFGRLHVLPVLVDFLRAHPGVDARLTLSDHVLERIDAGVDVAVRIASLPDSTLVAKRVGNVRSVVCASPDYLARRGEPGQPEDLVSHDCITVSGFGSPERWSFPVRGTRRINTALKIYCQPTST